MFLQTKECTLQRAESSSGQGAPHPRTRPAASHPQSGGLTGTGTGHQNACVKGTERWRTCLVSACSHSGWEWPGAHTLLVAPPLLGEEEGKMLLSAFLLGGPGATAGVGSGENPSARSYVLSQSVVSDSMDCSLPGSSVHGTVACQAPLSMGL